MIISVLIIEKEAHPKSSLQQALQRFEHLNIKYADSAEKAVSLYKKYYFELIFLDASCQKEPCYDAIRSIKTFNSETMVVAVNTEYDTATERRILSLGAMDYISKHIDVELMTHRVENYLQIAKLKKERLFNAMAVNLFDKNIYQRMTTYNLSSHSGIVEFWDYFKEECFSQYEFIEEAIGLLYALSTWLFRNHQAC